MRPAGGRPTAHRRLLLLFFLQNYLGPPLVLACVCPALYGLARAYAALVAGGVLVAAASFAAGYAPGIPATVAQRVAIWLDPWENGLGADPLAAALITSGLVMHAFQAASPGRCSSTDGRLVRQRRYGRPFILPGGCRNWCREFKGYSP
jgi:hypothetical protein